MLKKRMIFTLLYSSGIFMLSRNFRLQKVGNLEWINKYYNFHNISFAIDELIVLDVSRDKRDANTFCEILKVLNDQCFIPLSAGGGIRTEGDAELLINSGADKIVVNTILQENPSLVEKLVLRFGSQCIIASVDFKLIANEFKAFIKNGSEEVKQNINDYIIAISNLGVGEIYMNSMDKDGTGQGYVLNILNSIDENINLPIIIAGGAGNFTHLCEGIHQARVDAVATANLFNFIGDGLPRARKTLLNDGIALAVWDPQEGEKLIACFK
jgi:imidazole glycerol-phosphate synthase subunit HisF